MDRFSVQSIVAHQTQTTDLVIRPIAPSDASTWHELRCALWPGDNSGHSAEIAAFFAGTLAEPAAVLVAEDSTGTMVGIAELSIRFNVASSEDIRTGYIEGSTFVPKRAELASPICLLASRQWARDQGCVAFASDRADRVIVDRNF